MTRPSPYVFTLSEQDQAVLQERARAYSGSHAEVVRAKIVLLAAEGEPNTVIAARLDVHVDVVSRCNGSSHAGAASIERMASRSA